MNELLSAGAYEPWIQDAVAPAQVSTSASSIVQIEARFNTLLIILPDCDLGMLHKKKLGKFGEIPKEEGHHDLAFTTTAGRRDLEISLKQELCIPCLWEISRSLLM